ncbi:integral membrane protein [Lactiplantibacillus plantarum]|nr:integral membrane protein [Lactiplantibacillus plantarum]MCG0599415.1 integral membrane protein [Lactiplantibacillus plantarum]MCG0602022.1 integral membrane protein [Lactiplantibacillus plantarum]MCG0604977.1 integral membrane protein [Lactiplantibacillus plantarum]MCG0742531.1 integral membrane protein [Lactiplantibacillus plantarum]
MTEKIRKFNGQYWLIALVVGVMIPWLLRFTSISRFHQIVWLLFVVDFVLAAVVGCFVGLYLFFPTYVYYLALVDLGISYLAYGLTGPRASLR